LRDYNMTQTCFPIFI